MLDLGPRYRNRTGTRCEGGGDHRASAPGSDQPVADGDPWTHAERAAGHATRTAGAVHPRTRGPTADLSPHRPGAPKRHLRESRRAESARTRRGTVLRELQPTSSRQRPSGAHEQADPRRSASRGTLTRPSTRTLVSTERSLRALLWV